MIAFIIAPGLHTMRNYLAIVLYSDEQGQFIVRWDHSRCEQAGNYAFPNTDISCKVEERRKEMMMVTVRRHAEATESQCELIQCFHVKQLPLLAT